MTFKSIITGVTVFILSQGAFASKQVFQCERNISFVLFGLKSAVGESYTSGLMDSPVGRNGSQVTLTPRSRPNESARLDSVYAGSDYEGNVVILDIPKVIVGKQINAAFPVFGKIVTVNEKRETTLEISCLSALAE